MHNSKQPLAEVFGHLVTDRTARADRYRMHRLCPFNNKVPNCTKDKAKDPLGVCSIANNNNLAITCPIRFREDWLITGDAASFFFSPDAKWTSLSEIRLNDAHGKSAGNIDIVLVSYDYKGRIVDFGALEIQAVYISGNVRDPFTYYMEDPHGNATMDWSTHPNFPRPDYLSSSRKRLAPQLIFKGGILHSWGKRTAVALDKGFFNTLPTLTPVPKDQAGIAWFIYDLVLVEDADTQRYKLTKVDEVFTQFEPSLLSITTATPGDISVFLKLLQGKLDERMENPPTNQIIEAPF